MPISTTWAGLIDQHGSKRRLLELYWGGQLAVSVERFIEDQLPPGSIVGYKPIVAIRLERREGRPDPSLKDRIDNGQPMYGYGQINQSPKT